MSTGVNIGYGTIVRVGRDDGAGNITFTQLLGIDDIDLPSAQADEIEVTHMQSPNNTKEFIGGLIDNGEVSIGMHYVPGSDVDVLLQAIADTRETIQLEFTVANGGTAETYAAFLKQYQRHAPVKDAMKADATFRISGKVVA